MSRVPELLRQLADEIEQKEALDDTNYITINTRLSELDRITSNNNKKVKEVANAFATFANILGSED